MTFAQCQADALDLKTAMLDHGIVGCSIELQSGRGNDPWLSARKWLRMHHHTVSRWCLTCALTPVLGVCKNGRPGLPGPLCNGYGGYDGIYRIICMGLANHPGEGGPITIDGVHIPANSAREPTWGTEFEGGLQDWEQIEIRAYPGGMLEFMGRADAALAEWSGRPLTSQLEHSTWTSRKIDRLNFNRARGIALTQQWVASRAREDVTEMYAFIQAPGWPAVYLTNGMTKRHMVDQAELDGYRYWLQVGQQQLGVALWKNGEVDGWPADFIDRIPTVDPEDRDQLIDFVRNPHGDGAFLVFGSSMKLLLTEPMLGNHQRHWNARGYDTSIKDWSPADIDVIPELTAAAPEPPPFPNPQ